MSPTSSASFTLFIGLIIFNLTLAGGPVLGALVYLTMHVILTLILLKVNIILISGGTLSLLLLLPMTQS